MTADLRGTGNRHCTIRCLYRVLVRAAAVSAIILSGCVYYGDAVIAVNGVLVDEKSAPIEGAIVTIEPADDSIRSKPVQSETDANGGFAVSMTYAPDAHVRKFRMSVKKTGYTEYEEVLNGEDQVSRHIQLEMKRAE